MIASSLSVARLSLCNGLGISVAVISVTVSALVATQIGWAGGLSSVPYGIQFLTLLLATYPSAALMRRLGRRPVFVGSTLCGIVGAAAGYWAVIAEAPLLLCVAHALLGVVLANVNFYRFAALEVARPEHRSLAMSLVVFGGTFAAVLGPTLSRTSLFSNDVFASAYLGVGALCLGILALLFATPLPPPQDNRRPIRLDDLRLAARSAPLVLGVCYAAFGYGIMNLLMISGSIALGALGCFYDDIVLAIQWHVLAMFAPSLIMGHVIRAIGGLGVVVIGTLFIAACSAIAIAFPTSIPGIELSLILLGLGWNMTYVGGSYLLANNSPPESALGLQAINDVVIGVFAMLGAFLPGIAIFILGWNLVNVGVLLVVSLMLSVTLWSEVQRRPSH